MSPEKLQYCYALANDLEIRGEVASANFVRYMMREREELLGALERVLATIDDEADRAFPWPAEFREHSQAYRLARETIAKAKLR